jgi:pyridoxine 5'-phosphate synthase PdxJ
MDAIGDEEKRVLVSIFTDPEEKQIKARKSGANMVEIMETMPTLLTR